MTNELYHHGILGMKWGVRRYQNSDGTLTAAGKKRYLKGYSLSEAGRKKYTPEAEQIAKNVYSKHIKNEEDLEKAKEQYKEWDKAYDRRYWNFSSNKDDELRRSEEELNKKSITTKIYNDTFDELKKNNPSLNDTIVSDLAGTAIDDVLAPTVFEPVLAEKARDKKAYWAGEEDPEERYHRYEREPREIVENLLKQSSKPLSDFTSNDLNKVYQKSLDEIFERFPELVGTKYEDDVDAHIFYRYTVAKEQAKAKHGDTNSDELYHHGILGMKWGVRRYQNEDGSLTAAGKKRYGSSRMGIFEARRHKKKQAEAVKKRQATIQAKKDAEEEAKRHEEEKRNAITSGKASDIAKFQNELSNQELQDALRRLDLKRQLNNLSEAEKPKVKTAMDRVEEAMKTAKRASDIAENGVKAYNTFAKINNTFTKGKKLPIIKDPNNKDDKSDDNKQSSGGGGNKSKGQQSSGVDKPKGPQNSGGGSSAAADLAKSLKESKARTDRYSDDSERGFREDRVNTDNAWLKQRRAESDAFYEYMDKQAARLLDESANRAYAKRAASLSRSGSKWYEQVDRSAMESSASSLAAALNASRERIDELERNRR